MTELNCFKAYDIRGQIGVDISEDIVYRISRAVAKHLKAKSVIIGFDARETSPAYANAAARGTLDEGSNVFDIGMAGTEEMYWAVTEFNADAGIEITASHNPISYNGMKIVKSGSRPLDNSQDFQVIKELAELDNWRGTSNTGLVRDIAIEARSKYVKRILGFVDVSQFKPLKIVINSGNGAAGRTLDAIIDAINEYGATTKFIRVHHTPDSKFPNGIPNPLLPENWAATADVVVREGADIGVAFDGDFDRCFFFDCSGQFVPGEYIVGLLASIFLDKERGSKIVHDPRLVWNTQDVVSRKGGIAIQSKTGHAFVKETMRNHKAVYGGEMSAHHYFRDFAYCDSGMIPWLLIIELLSKSGRSLGDWVSDRFDAFPSSGETNFCVDDASTAIDRIIAAYRADALSIDETDGISLEFSDWRFNLRQSNTEPLVRLNIETKGKSDLLEYQVNSIAKLLGGIKA